jgi:hypothetical protein
MRFGEDAMDEPFDDEEEPFMLRLRSDVEVPDYMPDSRLAHKAKNLTTPKVLHGNGEWAEAHK